MNAWIQALYSVYALLLLNSLLSTCVHRAHRAGQAQFWAKLALLTSMQQAAVSLKGLCTLRRRAWKRVAHAAASC